MFSLIKQVFVVLLLSFSESLAIICMSLNDKHTWLERLLLI